MLRTAQNIIGAQQMNVFVKRDNMKKKKKEAREEEEKRRGCGLAMSTSESYTY